MSTRATYNIDGFEFYIHHDGYPAGAAAYFKKAVNFEGEGGLAEKFIRANERAELTVADDHGDTEYHYDVIGKHIIVRHREIGGEAWNVTYEADIYEFIVAHDKGLKV